MSEFSDILYLLEYSLNVCTFLKLWLLWSTSLLCSCLKLLHFLTSLWQLSVVISIPGWNLRLYTKKQKTDHRCPTVTQWDAGPICVSRGEEIFSFVSKLWCFQHLLTSTSLHLTVQNSLAGFWLFACLWRSEWMCVCFCSEQPPQHYTLSAPGFSSKDLKEAELRQKLQPLTVRWLHLTENTLGT